MRLKLIAASAVLALGVGAAEVPYGLTVEYRENPVGLQEPAPRFSWKLPDAGRGDVVQKSYRIRVERIEDGKAVETAWDSGVVESDQSVNVVYAGRPLASSAEYRWTVGTTDNHGHRGVSQPARWRMGLLRPEDWRAKWITVNPATVEDYDLKGAEWIGTGGVYSVSFELAADAIDPRAAVERATDCTWRPGFDARFARSAILACASDRAFEVRVNGRVVMKLAGSGLLRYVDIAGHLKSGVNQVEARVGKGANRAFIASIALPDGRSIGTGKKWTGAQPVAAPVKLMRRVEKHSPAFRRRFSTKRPVREAVLHITGLGFYEATLDGKRIGRKVLDPAPTDYLKRVLYSTYELTEALARPGEHVLDVLVGRGAYDEHVESWRFDAAPWRDTPCLIAQLELRYDDGSRETVVTDGSWRQVGSPVAWDDLREGEIHAPAPAIDFAAAETRGPKGRLEAEALPGAEKTEVWRPRELKQLTNGNWAVDFGQNMSGWARIKMRGLKHGDVVAVQYSEKRKNDGSHLLSGNDQHFHYPHSVLRMPGGWLERDRYVASGTGEEVYEPKFSYSGFRYVEIAGLREPPRPDDIEAYQVNTAFNSAGSFECSSDLMNRIHRLFVRAYLSNFTDGVPTDCPQREKNGWTGDAQLASEMGQCYFENTSGYEKWCRDLVDAQRADGGIPSIVPTGGWGSGGAGPAWDMAIAVVPWTLYRYRDDRRILETMYPAMVKYIRWGVKRLNGKGVADYGLGDWCAPVPYEQWSRYTPRSYTSTACWHETVKIAAEWARLLGREDDARQFKTLSEKAMDVARREFDKGDGVWASGTQCAQAAAISSGLVAPESRGEAAQVLVTSIETNKCLLTCGILGVKWLFRALSETGHGDLAIKMLQQTERPSFGDWLANGATTAWESWKGAASQNHIMFGDVSAWLMQYPGGIRPDAPGFKKILLAPETDGLSWVKAAHECPYGTIRSEWRKEGGIFRWMIEVPPNTTATVVPPKGWEWKDCIGRPAVWNDRPAVLLGSGTHALTLNGKTLDGFIPRYADLMAGGEMVFEMTGTKTGGNAE